MSFRRIILVVFDSPACYGRRATLADFGRTVAENFDTHLEKGTSFLEAIL
jgi:phosphopentomutase